MIAPLAASPTFRPPMRGPAAAERELTVLFYMNGEYGDVVGESVIENISKLEEIGSTPQVQVAAQIGYKPTVAPDGSTRYDTRRYAFGPPAEPAAAVQSSSKSITEAGQLRDFIGWGMEKYPSKHYLVVYQGHGGAWKGALSIPPARMAEAVSGGVADANGATGRQDSIDVQVFNTCLLGNLEALTQMRHTSRFTVASEDVAQLNVNQNWGEHLGWIRQDIDSHGGFDGERFARHLVEHYRGWQQEGQQLSSPPEGMTQAEKMARIAALQEKMFSYKTLTAVDNSKIEAVDQSLKELLETCAGQGVKPERLFHGMKASRDFMAYEADQGGLYHYTGHLRDAGDILDHWAQAEWATPPVREACLRVQQRLEAVILDEQHEGLEPGGLHGLTLWAPTHAGVTQSFRREYQEKVPDFDKLTGWGHFLEAAADVKPLELRQEFAAMEAEKLIKVFNAHLAQKSKLEGYPSLIEREQASLERKRSALARAADAEQKASLQREVEQKTALIARLQSDLEKAATDSVAADLDRKRRRLAELDPQLELAAVGKSSQP